MDTTASNSKTNASLDQGPEPDKRFKVSDGHEDSGKSKEQLGQKTKPNEIDPPEGSESIATPREESGDMKEKHSHETTQNEKEDVSENFTSIDDSHGKERNKSADIKQETQTGSAKNIINFGSAQNVSFNDYNVERLPDDTPFSDPTIELPERWKELPEFNSPQELDRYTEQLVAKRILVITCIDEDTAVAAAYGIIENIDVTNNYEKRYLNFEGINANRPDLVLGIFLDHKIGNTAGTIVIVRLKSQIFIDSMLMDYTYTQHAIEQLTKNEMMVICIGEDEMRHGSRTDNQSSFRLPQWSIPFLPHILRRHFSLQEAQLFNQKIINQRKSNHWGENGNEDEFYQLITRYLRYGTEKFREEVEKRDLSAKDGNKKVDAEKSRINLPQDHIKDDTPLHNTVIYVATFFPGLSPLDFSNIVLLLLADRQISMVNESQVINEKQEIKTIKSRADKRLADLWEENADKIMRECFLQTHLAKNNSAVVDFTPSFSRHSCKAYFDQSFPMFLRKQFARIQESGILFNFNAGEQVINNVIHLSAKMAISDPTYYGKDWLFGLVVGLKQYLNVEIEPGDYVEQLMILLRQIHNKEVRKQYSARLSELIREMLSHPPLKEMVHNFFDDLINAKHSDIALEIIVEITDRLQFAPHFDPLYWLKRFLDQGNQETRDNANFALIRLARIRGFRIFEILETISSWLPDPSKDQDRYSFSEKYALAFIIYFCISLRFREENYGLWPSRYPLFATLKDNESSQTPEQRLKLLIEWLFHPGIETLFGEFAVNIIADLIEEWITILYGFKEENTHSKAISLSDILLKQIILVADDQNQKAMIRHWQAKPRIYLNEINHLGRKSGDPIECRKEKEHFLRRRVIVHGIVRRFRQFCN